MTAQLFNGSALLLQDDLLHDAVEASVPVDTDEVPLARLAASIRHAFAAVDHEGALLLIEVDELVPLHSERQAELLDHVVQAESG